MTTDNVKPWVSILLAIISLVGSIVGAYFTSKSTSKDQIQDATKEFKAIHLESGHFDVQGKDAHLDMPRDTVLSKATHTPRTYTKHIDFDKEFNFTPVVRETISAIDAGKEANLRLMVYASNVNRKGFDVVIQTWSDSRIYYVAIDWFAYEQ